MPKKIDYASMFTLRKDGRYQGSYTDGTGKRRYVYDRNPERLYIKLQDAQKPKAPTFEDIAEAWHKKHWERIKDGTKANYQASYNRAIKEQSGKIASEITAADIDKHLKKLRDCGLSAKVIKTQRTIYKLIFENAIIDDCYGRFVRVNPATVPLPANMKPPVKREAPEDDIIEKIRQNATTAYFGLFAMFLISTGFRRGEALAVQWRDIDFRAKTIKCCKAVVYRGATSIEAPKTPSAFRTVPLLPDLLTVLHKPQNAKPTDFVFHSSNADKPMPEAAYKRHWHHYCMDMGFVDEEIEKRADKNGHEYSSKRYRNSLTAHVLRHGYATMLFEADVDVYTAQKLLGHANIETTQSIYTHLRDKKKNVSLEKLNTYISNNYSPVMS